MIPVITWSKQKLKHVQLNLLQLPIQHFDEIKSLYPTRPSVNLNILKNIWIKMTTD